MDIKNSSASVLHLATALIVNKQKQVLLVRKRGTTAFMQAGGKISTSETPDEALKRELKEELGYTFEPEQVRYLGLFLAPAAHEPGYSLEAHCYYIECTQPLVAHSEIEEIIWVNPFALPPIALASLTRDQILPLARKLLYEAPHK